MASISAAQIGESLGKNLQKVAVSTTRLATATALYGLDQCKFCASLRNGKDFQEFVRKVHTTVDSCTEPLEKEMGDRKKELLLSFTKATEDAYQVVMKGISAADPGRISNFLVGMIGKAAEKSLDRTNAPELSKADKPELAVEVLSPQGADGGRH